MNSADSRADDSPVSDCGAPFSREEDGGELRPLSPEPSRAGFWIRVVAASVDAAILTLAQVLLGLLLVLAARGISGGFDAEGERFLFLVISVFGAVLNMAYHVFFTGYCGQTPGKMAVRVKVIRTDGSEIGYGRSFLREVPGKFLSAVLLGAGYLMVAIDSNKQGLHDKVADTRVVKI